LLFFCRAVGGEMKIHPLECTDAGWFTRDHLPSPIIGAERWAGPIFAAIDGEHRDVFYDDLRRPVWRGDQ
jgi:NADH pyrophosphatase NudC (nudix superfamily)